ncbi:hypothetical protein GGR50DRAFT_56629 [Xylaria sp. CBS 124048]|nr:hypothetical protein GGR50DRAFT_56629 [Xylaria sp. CBS 124048]
MAPIPVYNNSPITAAKPDGVMPKSASATDGPSKTRGASSPPTTSTYTASTHSAVTATAGAAQPGATPTLPMPTGSAASQPYSPPQPNLMTPAPPKPGSAPISSLPPPPKTGEKYQPPTQTPAPLPMSSTTTARFSQQMATPTPTVSQSSSQWGPSTVPAGHPPHGIQMPPDPTSVGGEGAQSLSHPSGYQQNVNASSLDPYQRSAIERPAFDDSGISLDGVWGAAKKLAQQTGERLATAESELWKKINNG